MFESIAIYEKDDFNIGGFLGAGKFCSVHEAILSRKFSMNSSNSSLCDSNLERPFAIKMIKGPDHEDKQPQFAYLDLVRETVLLSTLNHGNIINIYGRGRRTPDCTLKDQYFIVLERLSHTLQKQIEHWSDNDKAIDVNDSEYRYSMSKNNVRNRLQVATSIASALAYLHSQNIIYRDLKPSNIGFNFHDQVKIFDFGLSIQLKPGIFPSEYIGSPRYMAPEVFQRCEYRLSADVYSFGILLWEICSLKKPFGDISTKSLKRKLIDGGRPKLNPNWSLALQNLISSCWDSDPDSRPSMICVQKVLTQEIEKCKEFEPRRRNSLFHTMKRRVSI